MNELQFFNNTEFGTLGIITIKGKPNFQATCCAEMLGYNNPQKTIADHCKEVTKRDFFASGGTQEAIFITESDLYRLIIRSTLQSTECFKHWIYDEVLPTIYKQQQLQSTNDLVSHILRKWCADL